ncbi:MAG: hypothetical protein IIY19_01150, partial [Lachnospiraceae bacterium]|nr:hypothetical protein [Lachnospiraceae bacterium]
MEIAGEMQIFLEKALSYNHFRCQDHFQILLVAPPLIAESIQDSWLGENFGYEYAVEVSKKIAGWYQDLSKLYHVHFLNAADYVKASDADGCHLDAAGQVRLGEAIAEFVKGQIFK